MGGNLGINTTGQKETDVNMSLAKVVVQCFIDTVMHPETVQTSTTDNK
ncbi:hypothetical protein [Pedobacter rhodius]|uniref:Uncharacterized protein n=1 Tax=Pedobacter rhodius TaxID=3004098 RepID=A0ABT4KSM4_9SPHI|nr:hypothetical protein [Pedobacter sp. SJ11]MCZ4221928.1 hypothetical protein [Pedobacter sp. SJ11]